MPPKAATTRSRAAAPAAGPSTSAAPAAPAAPAASTATLTSRSSVTFPDAATHDDVYDEDAIMEDVAAMTSVSSNEVRLPDTPGRLQDDEDEDLLDESNEFADNLVEELQETDDALLATLHLEREDLVSAWRTVVRRMAKNLATLSDANDADNKVKEIDQKIAMVKKLSQSEQPMDEDSTDKAEKKGAQRPALDDYVTARPAPRMNRGASSGANRNRNSGRNRFDPARRQPMQPAPATQQAAPRPQGRQQCNNCGPNNTHSTNGCLLCTFCNKRGHTVDECRARKYSNQANNNGADEPTQTNTAPKSNKFHKNR
ncbi:unnamed protein product [Mortierella alpina]